MSVKLNSYINFNGNAREAMEFYQSVFGGEIESDTFRSYASDEMPVADVDLDKIMHAVLKGDNGIELMGSDSPSTWGEAKIGGNVTLALNGDDEPTLRGYWEGLVEGGQVVAPLEKSPWGDLFGMLTDKFGTAWMINIGPER